MGRSGLISAASFRAPCGLSIVSCCRSLMGIDSSETKEEAEEAINMGAAVPRRPSDGEGAVASRADSYQKTMAYLRAAEGGGFSGWWVGAH